MHINEKVGEVKRSPLGALKRICEEYSKDGAMSKLLKYEKLVDKSIEKNNKAKKENRKTDGTRSLFPEGTMESIMESLRNEDEMII